ncbi:MAG TPA: pinensin family lanthipeptide [Longimicrobium sp.]|jgi:hypothetical protein
MKKLKLDGLHVESFATSADAPPARGTVAGHGLAMRTMSNCPVSWDGTCYVTCAYCETDDFCR